MRKTARQFVWRKLSRAQWEDAWQERLGWLGTRLVMSTFAGKTTLRLEAHQLSRREAGKLRVAFGGEIRTARALTARDLAPRARAPLRIRGRLLVTDRSHESRAGIPELVIPASMAFGTGEHATTATCLRMLADFAARQSSPWDALDLGTGTGVLALAARLLGARKILAGDWDAMAVRVARENASSNKIRGVAFRRFDLLKWRPTRRWDLVLANVYAPILIEAANRITSAALPGGAVILSGILREQATDVLRAFRREGCRVERQVRRGKWVTALLRVRRP